MSSKWCKCMHITIPCRQWPTSCRKQVYMEGGRLFGLFVILFMDIMSTNGHFVNISSELSTLMFGILKITRKVDSQTLRHYVPKKDIMSVFWHKFVWNRHFKGGVDFLAFLYLPKTGIVNIMSIFNDIWSILSTFNPESVDFSLFFWKSSKKMDVRNIMLHKFEKKKTCMHRPTAPAAAFNAAALCSK